jgi:hypothetical protein
VLRQFSQNNFESFYDKNGLEFDNIMLRKLYRTIILPNKVILPDEKSILFQVHLKPEFDSSKL